MARNDLAAAIVDRLGLVTVKIDLADLAFEFYRRDLRVVCGRAVGLEQLDGDLIDQIVARLGREDQGDEQLQRSGEIEIELGVGMDSFEGFDDGSESIPQVGAGRFLLHACHFGFAAKYGSKKRVAKGGISRWRPMHGRPRSKAFGS